MKKLTYKVLVVLLSAIFLLSACAPTAITTEAPPAPIVVEPTEAPEPTEVPPTLEPTAEPEPTEEPTPEPLVVTDDLGRTIELDEYPQAIVSLSPSITEILFAVGAGGQVIGRDDFSLYPEEALDVTSVGSMWGDLPTEAILAMEPDLVIVAQIVSEEQVTALEDLGLEVYWQANPDDFAGLYENLQSLAALTGHEDEAETLVASLDARVKAVEEKVSTAESTPSAFYELDASDPSNPWTTGSGTFIDYIITLAGGVNAAAALEGDYAQISSEELITVNPDIILLADAMYGTTPESIAERAGWDVMAAVQNEAVYPIDPGIMSIPGPRLVDGLEEVARLLHPDLFE